MSVGMVFVQSFFARPGGVAGLPLSCATGATGVTGDFGLAGCAEPSAHGSRSVVVASSSWSGSGAGGFFFCWLGVGFGAGDESASFASPRIGK